MIFVASTLVLNGGTTFLIRVAKEFDRRGQRCAVLLLTPRADPALRKELANHAHIIDLWSYLRDNGRVARGLLGVFAPLNMRRLLDALDPFGPHLHAMGIFGLVIGMRLAAAREDLRLSVGVYHQNEFLYRDRSEYLPRNARAMFAALEPSNIIFFNESSRGNYADHFGHDKLLASPVLPIGIELDQPPVPRGEPSQRIVSVGNLMAFKTYNKHIIRIVASLSPSFPTLHYDIYGTGPCEEKLRGLVADLGVADRVTFHGSLDYDQFRATVAACDLFVGSGTALLEAAAIGRPALVGIESMEIPQTYGFLSDISGFSYNEDDPRRPKSAMRGLVAAVLDDATEWQRVAKACAIKAQAFSIRATVDGLEEAGRSAAPLRSALGPVELSRMAASAVSMRLRALLCQHDKFGNRRNQGY